jgi:tetratricopeptide (TPR) repeat protein
VLIARGKLPEAMVAYQEYLAIMKRLISKDKSNSDWQGDLSLSYSKVGDVLFDQGKLQEALEAYQQSLNIRRTLAEQDKSNADWQRDLIMSLYKVGTTTAKIGVNDNVTQAQGFLQTGLNLAELYSGPDRQTLIDALNTALRTVVPKQRMFSGRVGVYVPGPLHVVYDLRCNGLLHLNRGLPESTVYDLSTVQH